MPGIGRYPCTSCHYVASNRRMLARHAVLIHSEKVFKCPLCPFITRYAANWYRHKRDLHGLTKITNCEICGFFANSTTELAQHKESKHPEHLHLEKYEDKYAKEKLRLGGNASESSEPVEEIVNHLEPDDVIDIYNIKTEVDDTNNSAEKGADSVTFSLPANGLLDTNEEESSSNGHNGEIPKASVAMNDACSSASSLGPLKVKRSYSCDQCGLLTGNPREFLYHLRDIHGEKINIFECKYCIYASKHVQKLHRHCNLVHRQLLENDPDYKKHLEATKKSKQPEMFSLGLASQNNVSLVSASRSQIAESRKPHTRRGTVFFNCSACEYRTRNKSFLLYHEKTAHLKKRFYRCLQCGYVTNEKGRYTKHIKYHSLPKMQCEYCFFKTAYKWNMDRHMKNHEEGAEGNFHCTECNFTTSTRQSFKSHVTHHHNANGVEEEEEFEDENGPNDSSDWDDIDVVGEQEDDSSMPLDENIESYDFPETRETTDTVWKDGKIYQKSLKCKSCDFKAAWPFELKKHEETHRSQKKHPCPLCGMRFEHIAWLTKHLRRVHQENSQAGSIAAAFDLMKPTRRKPPKEYTPEAVLPMYQQVLKQNVSSKPPLQTNQNSMLSTLLNKPLNPPVPSSANKYMFKSKAFAASTNMSRHLRVTSYSEKTQANETSNVSVSKPKTVPTCNVCGYKTRWLSELQRHMRVHSQEKPFHCHKCKYHCKWKGDLNRHLMKYHGIKVPSTNKKPGLSRLKFKRSTSIGSVASDWQTMTPEPERNHLTSSTPLRKSEEECPLDLTTKDSFSSPCTSSDMYDPYDFEAVSVNDTSVDPIIDVESEEASAGLDFVPYKSPLQQLSEQPVPGEETPPNSSTKRKYQCPFCTFGTTTASRFHVHIVQHYNRRPFMCSVCNHSSNWEWDITKHIRLKNCRDKFHNKACVLLTDESGRRNYEKYEKYLVDINHQPTSPRAIVPKLSESGALPDPNVRRSVTRPTYVEPPQTKSCSYDFRNIGSNFEDTPENIVVTPDINIPDQSEVLGSPADFLYNNQFNALENSAAKASEAKMFICKHCDFKHATKRVVVSHLSLHAGIKPYRCRACGITSNWRHVIVRHVKDAHNGYMNEVEDRINYTQEGFILRLTPPGFSNKEAGGFQPEKSQSTQFFECKICPYKCDKEFYMKFHMKQHRPREGAVFKCDYCPYFVKFKKTLVRHLKLHNGPSAVYNISENAEFSNASSYNTENRSLDNVQSDMYDFYSPQANDPAEDSIAISFDTLNQYSSSETTSPQKAKRHVCEGCPYKTDNKTQYLYHKQFHRPNPSAPFKCSVCSYWATMQHLLTQHMKVHESGNDCEQSSPRRRQSKTAPERARFDDDETYDKMSVVYVKRGDLVVKMFKCGYCPMMNKKKANVRVHQKMHGVIVNDGKFACSYCDYQCLNQGGLTNHLKIHQKVPEKLAIIEEHGVEYESSRKAGGEDATTRKKFFSYFCEKCPALFKSAGDLEIHVKFHGSSFPYPCTDCDYRAKHRPHLFKHMTVHSPEYVEKRNSAQRSVNSGNGNSASDPATTAANISIVKKIDQMLLLEASELSTAMKKTGQAVSNLHRCLLCPAVFIKTATLVYHISLHGSDGEFKCSQCDYAVNRAPNLTTHVLVHPKKTPVKKPPPARKTPLKSFPCTKCPAVFYKQDRFDRHFNLHGKNWKFVCEHCDYSVRFAANLIKHRRIHVPKNDSENATPAIGTDNSTSPALQSTKPLSETVNILDLEEKKLTYICDRCPYSQARKDAVQSHMRRHWLRDGFKCPYCDYSSMQSGFLQTHIKMHIQPNQLFPAQCFMKYESFKIWCKDDNGEEVVLFDDETMAEEELQDENEGGTKRPAEEENSERCKIRKLSCDSSTNDSNYSDSKTKVPVVVLSDIFTSNNKDFDKWVPKLKIPKLKITKSSSNEKMYTKINISEYEDVATSNASFKAKPSLVVKISKVECFNNHEKTMYSISTKSSDNSFSSPAVPQSSVCPSGINLCDSEPSVQTGTNSTADNRTTESRANSDVNGEVDKPNFLMNSVSEHETASSEQCNSLLEKQRSTESNEPMTGVKIPLTDFSRDKLNDLTDLSFEDELPLTNAGLAGTHLTNGLGSMPEEIKVDL